MKLPGCLPDADMVQPHRLKCESCGAEYPRRDWPRGAVESGQSKRFWYWRTRNGDSYQARRMAFWCSDGCYLRGNAYRAVTVEVTVVDRPIASS